MKKVHGYAQDAMGRTICKRDPDVTDVVLINKPMFWLAVNRVEDVTCLVCLKFVSSFLYGILEISNRDSDQDGIDCYECAIERIQVGV